jgi:hypothetical protein
MDGAPFLAVFPRVFRGLDAVADLAEPSLSTAFALEISKQLPVSGHQRAGTLDDERDFVIAVAFAREEDNTGKGGQVVFDRSQSVIETMGDLVRLEALQEQPNRLGAMGLSRSDVLLLATCGHLDAGAVQDLDVADDGAQGTVEQAEGEIFVREQAALLAGLGSQPQQARAAEPNNAATDSDLEIVLAGIESQTDRDLLTVIERLAGRFVGGDDQELDLAESELALDLLGIERKDFLGGLQDSMRDEGRAVGPGFDAATEQVIQGLGIGPLLAHFVFDAAGTDHGRHLRSKPDQ